MKIAIWHQEDIHFEMLGYLIDYCQQYSNIELHIYTFIHYVIAKDYMIWYSNFFKGIKIIWRTAYDEISFKNENYDVIILVSDSNTFYKTYLKDNYIEKTISIEHWYQSRSENISTKICVRKFFNRPEIPYAMPCYNIISEYDKLKSINRDRLNVVFMGRFNIPSSTTLSYFNNFDNIDFHFIDWKIEYHSLKYLKNIPNLYVHEKMSNDDMIKLMNSSHFVFFYPSYIEGYPQHKTSATLHLAFSTLCIPIIPTSWNTHYKFSNNFIIEYDDLEFLRPNEQLDLSIDLFLKKLPYLTKQRSFEISKRNTIFDNLIQKIAGVTPQIYGNNIWFNNVINNLSISVPKVFVETGSYLGNGISYVLDNFREIYSIDINDNFIKDLKEKMNNYRHLHLYNGDSSKVLSELIDNINEPAIFFLDAHFSGGSTSFGLKEDNGCPLLRELNILSTRKYNDIIIIDDMRLMGKKSTSGIEGTEYPPTEFDFTHITKEKIIESYSNKDRELIIHESNDIDRLILISIPKIINKNIIQICVNPFNYKNIPNIVYKNILEKGKGYNYILYTDNMINNILNETSLLIQQKYFNTYLPTHKKDLIELILLYNYGGIYFDLDQEPLISFDEMIFQNNFFQPTFVGMIPINKNDGIAIGFMGSTQYNPILKEILLSYFKNPLEISQNYVEYCQIAGNILKKFMNVEELNEGLYEVGNQKIMLIQEIWEKDDYTSCKGTFQNKILFNSRYKDYPWNLRS